MMNSNSVKPVNQLTLKIFKVALSIAVIPFVTFTSVAQAGDLIIVVENIKNDQGAIRVSLFSNEKDFPKNPGSVKSSVAKIGMVSFIYKNIPAGNYALLAFHDMNSNDKLDTNFVGKPVEPYGFSHDARGTFGPPSFSDAAISIDESGTNIKIILK